MRSVRRVFWSQPTDSMIGMKSSLGRVHGIPMNTKLEFDLVILKLLHGTSQKLYSVEVSGIGPDRILVARQKFERGNSWIESDRPHDGPWTAAI